MTKGARTSGRRWWHGESVAGVVGVAGEDGEGAVGLLGEDDAGELVGQGDAAQGEEQAGAGAGVIRPAVCGADGEDEALGSLVAVGAEGGGEFLGGELFAAAVEEDDEGGDAAGLGCRPLEEGRFGLEELRAGGDVTAARAV